MPLDPALAEQYLSWIEQLRGALNAGATKPGALPLLRELIERVAVHPGPRSGEARLELNGRFETLAAVMNGGGAP